MNEQKEIEKQIDEENKDVYKPLTNCSEQELEKSSKDSVTKAFLNDHPEEEIDILGNGQLKKKVIKPGQRETRPNIGDICIVNITGKLNCGDIVEEIYDFEIQLGHLDVVQGLDLAIPLMDVGEVAEIHVDPRFAYGNRGKELVPPNTVITYTVELKSAEIEPEIEMLSPSERTKIGKKKRDRGNWWFHRMDVIFAIQCYRKALEYLSPTVNTSLYQNNKEVSDTELQALHDECLKVHSNLAAALMSTEAYDTALEHIEYVLHSQPQNAKALHRKGRILKLKGEYASAYTILCETYKLNPDIQHLLGEISFVKSKLREQQKEEKKLYRKMLGTSNSKNTNNLSKNVQIKDKNALVWGFLWTLAGGASVAIIGILVHRFVS